MQCPICGDALRLDRTESSGQGTYQPVYVCPNEERHGTDIRCRNCQGSVRFPNQHYTFTRGLLGSELWTCVKGKFDFKLPPEPQPAPLESAPASPPRPHPFIGRLYDSKCAVCELQRHGTDSIHSTVAIGEELARLHALEDAVNGDLEHVITMKRDDYVIKHPLQCRIDGLELCALQHSMTDYTRSGYPLPEPGVYTLLFDSDFPDTLVFDARPHEEPS